MIISGTGHRCNKLPFAYQYPNPFQEAVFQRLRDIFTEFKPEKVISGMAVGFDTWLALVALEMKIPLVAAVPFVGQEKMWPAHAQDRFNQILKQAEKVVIVSEGGYAPEKMQVRNQYLVDHCDKLIALWDGTNGGTGNCVRYAEKVGREIVRIVPKDLKY